MSVTLILIAITCAVSLVALNNPKMLEALILWPPAVAGRWRQDSGQPQVALAYGAALLEPVQRCVE